ncbi:hypothetical protein ScPMuIL_018713 [Solemya velum]
MAALVEGHQYGLSSHELLTQNKTVVHVKLTDSALKTIEEFVKSKHVGGTRPSIQFMGNQGIIRFHSQSGDTQTFQFSVSGVQGDPNGSLDCVRQTETRHGGHLEMQGSMTQRINIRATSEVFSATKQKRVIAEEESKKVCTKEIKPSGPNISRKKVMRIRDRNVINSLQSKPQPSTVKAKPLESPNFSSNTQPSHRPHHPALTNGHTPTSTNSSVPHQGLVSSSIASKPTASLASRLNGAPKPNSGLYNMPYRDRVTHLLAVRPYKKPELLLRLKRDGIKEKDKNSLSTTLQQVSTLNSRDNSYHLAKHVFQEIRLEWPYYTEEDRILVKKRLQSASPASSPANHQPSPESPTGPQKRPTEPSSEHQPAKKQRISHYDKLKKENKPVNGLMEGEKQAVLSDQGQRKENIKDSAMISQTPDYVVKYHAIQTADQRQRYKLEFNKEYEEYRQIHCNMEKVAKKFAELEVLMKKTSQGTEEYETLKNRIRMEYKAQKSDPKYVDQKKKFEYLHQKLGFIKKLILDYDSVHVSANS